MTINLFYNMLYIYLKSHDVKLLDTFCNSFFFKKRKNLFQIKGPIFLPKKRNIYTVIRSPHVYSLSREHFEISTFRRLFIINLNKFDKKELNKFDQFFFIWLHLFPTENSLHKEALLSFRQTLIKHLPVGISLKFNFKI